MRSLRRQLTVSMLACVTVALTVAGGILYLTVTDALVTQFDRSLAVKAAGLGALLEYDGEHVEFNYIADAMPEFQGGPEPEYFGLWFAEGTEATRSTSLGETRLPRRFGPASDPEIWDLPLPDGRAGRALGIAVPAYAKDDPEAFALEDLPLITIVVARSRADLDASLAALVTGLLAAAVVALALVAWSVTLCVRHGLAPLRRLNEQVEQMDAASLSRKVQIDGVPAELSPSVVKLNELFARLQDSFTKERRMTAAMAHELRTPIAELRSASDVAQRWPEDESLADDLAATAGDVALRMSSAVEALMRYCRLEAGQADVQRERVHLAALLDKQWKHFEKLADERGVRFSNGVPDDAVVVSDRGLLGIVFGNLLNNAASFAAAGAIRARLTAAGDSLTVHVSNATDQLAPEDLAHVSEPFWRKDAARTDGSHSGLGLTLVVSIADVLGCTTRFELVARQFTVAICMPAEAIGHGGRAGRTPNPAVAPAPVAAESRASGAPRAARHTDIIPAGDRPG